MNKVSFLLKNKFTQFRLEDQLKIKTLGRDLPDINVEKPQVDKQTGRSRKFNRTLYSKNNWICGCDEKNKMFCFPCILYGGDEYWAESGVDDLVHVWEKMKIHEKTMRHMHNVFSLAILGKVDIKLLLNANLRAELVKQNDEVRKNRQVLEEIISNIRTCKALDLALRARDNGDNFQTSLKEIIDFGEEIDQDIKEPLNKLIFFKGSNKIVQNELLECIYDTYRQEITKQIKESKYVALIVDETADVSCKYRLLIILRYLVKEIPVERFWNILYPEGYDAETVVKCILKELKPLLSDNPRKLISLSYDGPSIVSGSLGIIQSKIKEKYPSANYVHYYGHTLNNIISSATSVNKQARICFTSLVSLCSFIQKSSHVISVLNEVVGKKQPNKWDFDASREGVSLVFKHRKDLIKVMDFLEKSANDATVNQAGGYKFRLQDKEFIFWLGIFNEIIPHVAKVVYQVQLEGVDSVKKGEELRRFEQAILAVQKSLNVTISNIENEINSFVDFDEDDEPGIAKKPRVLNHEKRREEAMEVCNSLIRHVNIRFGFLGHLTVTNLFKVLSFKEYRMTFPNKYLDDVVKHFTFIDKAKLKIELQVVYERPELRVISGAMPLLALLEDEELKCTFQEVLKLLSLLCTMPMRTLEAERCFAILKNSKVFLGSTANAENLCALMVLCVEKEFLIGVEDFNHRVVELYADRKKRLEFIYRNV